MRPQAFQAGEVRDEHDNIIREGAYGKKTPFATADNSGILDYIINNFDVLDKGIKAAGVGSDENGNPTLPPIVSAAWDAIKLSEANAGKSATTATTKASEASVSATKAKASETASKTSETNAKASETKAKTSETTAGKSATTATQQATKATTEANRAKTEADRAKTEADRAKTAADRVGIPVVNITQSNGNLTITKGDGSNTSIALPAPDVSNLAKLHENNVFTGTNEFYNYFKVTDFNQGRMPIFEAKQGEIGLYRKTTAEEPLILKNVSSKYTITSTASRVRTDVVELKTPNNTAVSFNPQTVWNFSSANETKVCVLLITGAGTPTIEWANCKMCCEAPAKTANKATIVTFFITDTAFYLVSAMQEV